MRGGELVLVAAGLMVAAGLLIVLAWFVYTSYLDRVERRLATRKGLYRELVGELATRDRALLEPTIHQMRTLYDLDALEAVLEEQARTATGRPGWLLEVYDQLGLVDKYIEKLRTARKWRDRAFAAELLGRVGSAKAVPALLETVDATQTEDADVREIALRALARIADPLAIAPLVHALSQAEPWLAPRIADILARHGEAAVDPLLALLAQSGRHPARAWAANVLGEVRAQRAFPALMRSLDDPDEEVRAKAVTALGRLGDRRAVPALLDRLVTDPAPFVRVRIAATLGQFGGPEVIDRMVRALGDPAWWVRMRGVEALEQIGPVAEGPLLVALNDPDPTIRERAAVSLERLGVTTTLLYKIENEDQAEEATETLQLLAAAGTRELLAELMAHGSPRVRSIAISAIHRSGRQDLAPELTRLAAADPDPALRRSALDELRRMGAAESLPVALTAVSDPDQLVRIAALRLLGRIGGLRAFEAVRAQTGNPEPQIRAAAIHALGEIGGPRVQADFLSLLRDPDPLVRETAVWAVLEAGIRPLSAALLELLSDREERVRLAAAESLGFLGDRSAVPALLRAFNDATPAMRRIIALAISRLDVGALGDLIDRLIAANDVESRLTLAHTLGRRRMPAGLKHLSTLAGDVQPEVRSAALQAIGRCAHLDGAPQPEGLAQAVANGFNDEFESVRAAAIDVCSRKCLEEHGHTLISLLQKDSSPVVRERAALAIGLLRSPAGQPALVAASRRDDSPEVRAAAALAAAAYDRDSLVTLILEMQDQSSIRQLLRERIKADPWFRLLSRSLPRSSDAELRAVAAPSAGEAQSALAEGMRGVLEAGERVRLITGLRSFQGEESRGALLQLVRSDPSPEVRTAALISVSETLDPDELLAFGSRALGDPSVMVRRAAVGLFGRVPPARAFPRLIQALRMNEDPAVLTLVAGMAEEHFPAFREAVFARPLEPDRAVLVARVSRYVHHADLGTILSQLARSPAPEVREAIAEAWRHRPDAGDPLLLEGMTMDPVVIVRRTAAGAAAAAQRFDLLDRMTQDPESDVRREVAITLGRAAPVGSAGITVLEHLQADPEMPVRGAAYIAHLLQGVPVPFPPDLDPKAAAEAVREGADIGMLRNVARTGASEDRRLAAALALALIQDEVARDVARIDSAPSVRHRVAGALELSLPGGEPA